MMRYTFAYSADAVYAGQLRYSLGSSLLLK